MKKALATAMVILTVLCLFTACKKDGSGKDSTDTDDIKVVDLSTTREREETTAPKANKNITVSIPKAFVESKAGGDIEKYAATYGYKILRETDGSITMKMDGMTYSFMLSGVGMDTIIALGDIVDSDEYPFAVKLGDYNSDFSYILMLIDTDKYEGNPSYKELAELIGLCGLYYQYFTIEKDNRCEVILASEKSGKVLYRDIYTD
ncbi:MAG: hypothetical protein J6Q79_06280 [Clostridia bacterium]|nr:hypothetical protein [Clostridia bacterium]